MAPYLRALYWWRTRNSRGTREVRNYNTTPTDNANYIGRDNAKHAVSTTLYKTNVALLLSPKRHRTGTAPRVSTISHVSLSPPPFEIFSFCFYNKELVLYYSLHFSWLSFMWDLKLFFVRFFNFIYLFIILNDSN